MNMSNVNATNPNYCCKCLCLLSLLLIIYTQIKKRIREESFFQISSGDKFGRRTALYTGMAISIPCTIIGGFVQNYALYVLLRLITCACLVFGWIACHNIQVSFDFLF